MILRKPYAFLIKHFRMIHGIIFILMIYLFVKSISIYSFFSDYATRHYFTPVANLVNNYINILMFVISVLTIIFSFIVYYLLSIKKKSRGIYFFVSLYYILLIIYFIYIHSVFIGLEDNILSTESVRVLRDISLIAIIPQLIFIIIMLLRTLGFNIKKFEFKSDLEDLQIDESDYEEIEVTLGKNNYKYARFFRKTLRYLKYFLQENKFFITIIMSIIVLSISILFYVNTKVTNVIYYENNVVHANTLWYKVKNSYLTNTKMNGTIIKDNKYYVLVRVEIDNRTSNKYELSRELFRLKVNDELLVPIFNMDECFMDLGNTYKSMSIKASDTQEVIIVFEIDKNNINNEFILKINNNENTNISSDDKRYTDIIIKPTNLDNENENKNYVIPANVEFEGSMLGNTKLSINTYLIDNNFKEKIKYCINNNCYEKVELVESKNKDKGVIKIKTILDLDDNIYMKKYINNASDLFEYYGIIKYRYLGNSYESNIIKINNKNLDNTYTYLEVPSRLMESDKIELILNIRGKIYSIVLK